MDQRPARRRYDEKIVKSNKSTELLKLHRIRRIVIILWALICITGAILFYTFYASKEYSNTPKVAITTSDGVNTGTKLTPGAKFGPWDGE